MSGLPGRPAAGRTGEEGLSLVELLLAMVVGALLLSLVTTEAIGMMRGNAAVTTIGDQIGSTTTPGQRIERALRSAVPLACDGTPLLSGAVAGTVGTVAAPSATDISFFTPPLAVPTAAPAPAPLSCGGYALQLVHIWVDAPTGQLQMAITPATVASNGALAWNTANTTSVTLGTGYAGASTSLPLFQYYAAAQATAVGGGTPQPVPLASTDLPLISAVDVTLRADLSAGPTPTAQVLTYRVRLANA